MIGHAASEMSHGDRAAGFEACSGVTPEAAAVTLTHSPAYQAIYAAGDLVRTEDALHERRRRQRWDSGDWIGCRRLKRDDHKIIVDVSTQHLNIEDT